MSHTAGLRMSVFPDDFDKYLIRRADNVSQTIKPFKDIDLLSKPGTAFNYSNYGYQMVGAFIESILNNTYENEMKKMFTQLNMNSTFAERREAIYKHRPQYYQLSNLISGTLQKCHIIDELVSYEGWWPAGGIISTAEDMIKFGNVMIAAYKGILPLDFISQQTVKELWRPETIGIQLPKEMGDNDYGKAWFIQRNPSPFKEVIWHPGGITGTTTMLSLFPGENMVGVAFVNRGAVEGEKLVLDVAKMFKQFT
ncbi:unnamed protein product [Oppiella nova]|uniref:Beta-lactamase-related domain-containing protein n=1 Tax=Oppiella nova TaxID=334625 RepID=A0A7R9QU87_9ACAR|nr:unnamed protein product [Oppiella nova]CAG2174235.1 unnamed protein product [Oppiella nova]